MNSLIPFCPKCGTVYEDFDGNACPRYGCTASLQRFEAAAIPIVVDLYSRGFAVTDIHIGTAFDMNPHISVTFADFYHFMPLPEGFEIESQYTHDNAPPNTPTTIAKRFNPDLSIHAIYREWLRSLSEITLWALAMPLPIKSK